MSAVSVLFTFRLRGAACFLSKGARCDVLLNLTSLTQPLTHTLTAFITRLPSNSNGDTFNNGVFVRVVSRLYHSSVHYSHHHHHHQLLTCSLFTLFSPLYFLNLSGSGDWRRAGCRCFAFFLLFLWFWGVREGFARVFLLRERKADSLFLSSSLFYGCLHPPPFSPRFATYRRLSKRGGIFGFGYVWLVVGVLTLATRWL